MLRRFTGVIGKSSLARAPLAVGSSAVRYAGGGHGHDGHHGDHGDHGDHHDEHGHDDHGHGHGDHGHGHGHDDHGHGHHHHFSAPKDQHKLYEGSFSTGAYGGMHNDVKTRDISKLRYPDANTGDNGWSGAREPPMPPAIPVEPIQPIDFNPHIEIWEFPKEIFDPKFPFTREDNIMALDEIHEASYEEMAHRYGVRVNANPRAFYFGTYIVMVMYSFHMVWSVYRSQPNHKHWNSFAQAIAQDDPPTIDEDDAFLDHWHNPIIRQSRRYRHDANVLWKPMIKENANPNNSWTVKFEHRDPSEWRHMTSAV